MLRPLGLVLTCLGVLVLRATSAVCGAEPNGPQRIDSEHLPNAYRVADKVISGGQPAGEAAFAALKSLGVRTIISVDGARPDVELAKKYGLTYVHLPHGYDGVPDERAKELAKAVRDLPGPIYIHCHHGHHRSPAAAAVACVAVGFLRPEAALAVLKTAGTSENYRGLYQSALAARRLDDKVLDLVKAEFPEMARLPPIADAMVEIEHTHDHLEALAAGGWKRLAKQPDLDPAHEALLLKEHYHELLRTAEVQRQPLEFQQIMQAGERDAESLEASLRAWLKAGSPGSPPEAIAKSFTAVSQSCTACHSKFRDVPLSEKVR
ncbi:MAG: hypothetical protein L0211_04700 [Planctomycetaceae bacterium]|nr:hypothetical protein [Planctomycetaceae bacterium]